jgi:hypothetical protein
MVLCFLLNNISDTCFNPCVSSESPLSAAVKSANTPPLIACLLLLLGFLARRPASGGQYIPKYYIPTLQKCNKNTNSMPDAPKVHQTTKSTLDAPNMTNSTPDAHQIQKMFIVLWTLKYVPGKVYAPPWAIYSLVIAGNVQRDILHRRRSWARYILCGMCSLCVFMYIYVHVHFIRIFTYIVYMQSVRICYVFFDGRNYGVFR